LFDSVPVPDVDPEGTFQMQNFCNWIMTAYVGVIGVVVSHVVSLSPNQQFVVKSQTVKEAKGKGTKREGLSWLARC